jgi:uncharacterized protein (TIGR03000 family)
MKRLHLFLLAALVGGTTLLASASPAAAYWRRGGYHPYYGYYHGYHPYYNRYYHPYHNYYYHPYYSPYRYPYSYPVAVPYAYPYYVNTYGVASPSNPDVTDYSSFASNSPATGSPTSEYVLFSAPSASGGDTASRDTAAIHVIVTTPNAVVEVNGQPTTSTGTTRLYVTPPLPPGRESYYEVTVTSDRNGRPVTQTRKIYVAPGQSQVVDFTRAETK